MTAHAIPSSFVILFLAALWAGIQNALAGGGAFITLPSLMLTGMDARAANMTSTIALFPAQLATGWTGRRDAAGAAGLTFRALVIISLIGGAIGAGLLLVTSAAFFGRLVPWLVLFATAVFAWGSFAPRRQSAAPLDRRTAIAMQVAIAVYGGFFGGGIGFLMLAVLTAARVAMRNAAATKNVLTGVTNAAAVVIFAFSPEVRWAAAVVAGGGAILGGIAGAHLLRRVSERVLRGFVVLIGVALTIGLFLHST
jgi:uncharacterized membrane protein YfcA